MLTDPQILTVNSVAKSMPRIMIEGQKSTYQTSDEIFKLIVSHLRSGKRIRTMSRVEQRAVVQDPLSLENDYDTLPIYTVIDRPEVGFSVAQIQQLAAAHFALMTPTFIAQLVGGES